MRNKFCIYILLLTLLIALTGCDNGSSDSAVSSNSLVKVCLTVDSDSSADQKIVSVTDGINWAGLTYEYKAEAQWTSSNIQGETSWTSLNNYSSGMSLGYFSPGQWKFSVRIKNGSTIIYEGSSITYISPGNVNVTVLVSKMVEDAAAGSVHISVTAPTVAGENLGISYTLGNTTIGPVNADATSTNGITTFEKTISDLAKGEYTFFLSYLNGNSGATVAVNLHSGERAEITGTLDNGVWQIGYIIVKVYEVTINKSGDGNVRLDTATAAAGERVSFSVEPFKGAALDGAITVTWGNNNTIYPVNDGEFYTFIMPASDVNLNVAFTGSNTGVSILNFKIILKLLLGKANGGALIFGRSNSSPGSGVSFYELNDVILWYDTNAHKICWNSDNNTLKFKPGSLEGLFRDCSTLTTISLEGLDTSSATSMAGMFKNCSALTTVDMGGVDTSAVTSMAGMFQNCTSILSVDLSDLDTSAVQSMAYLFDNCVKLQSADLTGFDTSDVQDMSYMFNYAGYKYVKKSDKWNTTDNNDNYLTIAGIDGFNTENVTNMSHMFYTCSAKAFGNNNLSNFNPKKCTDFSYMFSGECSADWNNFWYAKYTTLNVAGWEVGKAVAADAQINMAHMFDMCNRLTSIAMTNYPNDSTKGWDFSKVIDMASMFNRCESATSILFPKHTDLSSVTTLCGIFNRNRYFPLGSGNGDGGFTDIFSRWDISGNTAIDFVASPAGYKTDETPNRLIQNDTVALNANLSQFDSYTANIKISIGGSGLSITQQRLKKVVVNQ